MTSGTKGVVAWNGKVIMVLRDDKPDIPYPNTWDCIGGAKDEGESFQETGLREVEEELGVRPENYYFLGVENYLGRQAGRFIAMLSDKENGKVSLGSEGQKIGYFSLDETLNLETPPFIKRFLENNYRQLKMVLEKNSPIESQKFELVNETH